MNSKQQGFTLIELIVVMVILGVLAATALPRFLNVSDTAHETSVNSVAGALAAAVALSHAQWMITGHAVGADVDNLQGYGDHDLNMTLKGWPRGNSGTDNTSDMTDALCVEVWQSLLQVNAPSVSMEPGSAYMATAIPDQNNTGHADCLFVYQGGNGKSAIRYDADNGKVTIVLD